TQPGMEEMAGVVSRVGAGCGKPLLFVNAAGSSGEAARRALRERRYLCFDSAGDALRALQALVSDYTLRVAYAARSADVQSTSTGGVPDPGHLPGGVLADTEAIALVSKFGIPVARGELSATPEEAAAAAARIGYPVALKGSARGLVHKSDSRAVQLDLRDAAAVRAAFDSIRAAIAARYGRDTFRGCLVQEMVEGDAELILGVHHDQQFGGIFAIGMGGGLIELLRDVRLLPLPLTRSDTLRALRGLRLLPL